MTHERELIIRQAWARCRHDALRHFRTMPVYQHALRPKLPMRPMLHVPATESFEVIHFTHTTTRNDIFADRPHRWRIVCEDMILEQGIIHPDGRFGQ